MARLLTSLTARALSFAHLAGVGAGAARASDDDDDTTTLPKDDKGAKGAKGNRADDGDDDERKQREGESDEDYDKRMKALDDEDDKKAKGAKGAKGARGDDDGDDTTASADDDKDEEMRGSSAAAAARRREQARCATIFASPAAGKNPVLAAKLAFTTRMPRDEALAILEGTPAPTAAAPASAPLASNVAGRSDRNPRVSGGDAPKLTGQAAIDASWDAVRALNKKNGY